MATTNTATVNARIDAMEAKLDTLLQMLASTDAKPAPKQASKAKANGKAKASAKANAPKINVRIPGKPSKTYIERAWVWIAWDNKPTDSTIAKLKANGWVFSAKRKAWHKVNA